MKIGGISAVEPELEHPSPARTTQLPDRYRSVILCFFVINCNDAALPKAFAPIGFAGGVFQKHE